MRLCVFASELSGLVGRNPFVDVPTAVEKLLCRVEKRPTRQQEYENSMSVQEKSIVTQNLGGVDTAKDVERNLDSIRTQVDRLDVCPEEKKKIMSVAERIQKTEFGTRNEESVRRAACATHCWDIKKDDRFTSKNIYFKDSREAVLLGGKCDGTTAIDGEDIVVEIKNRTRRLFLKIPDYEKVQLMAYMYIYNVKKSLLIESFEGQRNEIFYDFDPVEWDEIVQQLGINLTQHGILKAKGF